MPPKTPPQKRTGQGAKPRRLNGLVWDVATAAQRLGETEKSVRSQINRGLLPHRRLGGRVILIADEVLAFLRQLPGVTAEEALENTKARQGEGPTR